MRLEDLREHKVCHDTVPDVKHQLIVWLLNELFKRFLSYGNAQQACGKCHALRPLQRDDDRASLLVLLGSYHRKSNVYQMEEGSRSGYSR